MLLWHIHCLPKMKTMMMRTRMDIKVKRKKMHTYVMTMMDMSNDDAEATKQNDSAENGLGKTELVRQQVSDVQASMHLLQ